MEEPIIEVRRMRAAYGLADATAIGPKERDELARLLLSGKRAYDLESATYQAWRQKHEEQYMQWRRKRVVERVAHSSCYLLSRQACCVTQTTACGSQRL